MSHHPNTRQQGKGDLLTDPPNFLGSIFGNAHSPVIGKNLRELVTIVLDNWYKSTNLSGINRAYIHRVPAL